MRRLALSALLGLAGLAGCDAASSDPGLSATMRATGAQFVEGAMPALEQGPEIASIDLSTNRIQAGEIDKPLGGALDPAATAAALGLDGDRGFWIVPAGLPGVEAPGFPTFTTKLSFAPDLAAGAYTLRVRASDEGGHLGAPMLFPLTATGAAPPPGALVVTLSWDTESDLDLHVVDPLGVEIYKRNINSYEAPPPGKPADPDAWQKGGILDFDSNAECVIDGRRREDVVWKASPPKGHYRARVDTFSLCGQGFASWKVDAFLAGARVAHAEGSSGETDEQMPHDRGAGVLAVEFDVP